MNLGRFQLGTRINIRLQCLDSSGSPAMPSAVPAIKVWTQGGTLVLNKEIPVEDKRIQPGLFHYSLFLGNTFAAGNYHGEKFYMSGSTPVVETFCFDAIAGGNTAGQAISAIFYHRPQADFIVYQVESGQIRFGANPRVA